MANQSLVKLETNGERVVIGAASSNFCDLAFGLRTIKNLHESKISKLNYLINQVTCVFSNL